jgi:hypothetical protein
MPSVLLKNPYVSINAVNLSGQVKAVELSYDVEELDATAASASGAKATAAGLKNWSANVTFLQDFTAGSVDATLFAAHGTLVACEIRADGGAVSPTNPKYTGTALVKYGKPIGGNVGQLLETSVSLVGSGDLSRATA